MQGKATVLIPKIAGVVMEAAAIAKSATLAPRQFAAVVKSPGP